MHSLPAQAVSAAAFTTGDALMREYRDGCHAFAIPIAKENLPDSYLLLPPLPRTRRLLRLIECLRIDSGAVSNKSGENDR